MARQRRKYSILEWIEELSNHSNREVELQKEIDEETARFESTPEYKGHWDKVTSLYKEIDKERNARMKRFKEKHPVEEVRETLTEEKIAEIKEASRLRLEQREAALSPKVTEAIKLVTSMDEKEFKDYRWKYSLVRDYHELDKYDNPVTTEEDIQLLQHVLVQTAIAFIKERGLKDIDTIGFSVDGLESSVEYGSWAPETDSSITVEGIQDGYRKEIGNYM